MHAFGTFGSLQHRSRILIGVILCVCIVTVGCVGASRGQQTSPRTENVLKKGAVVVMGHKSSASTSEDDEVSVVVGAGAAPVEMLHTNTNFGPEGGDNERTLEERLLANQGHASGHVRHPHVTVPQLPFCKPTKSTVGSGTGTKSADEVAGKTGKSSSGRYQEKDEFGSHHEYDDENIEVVNTDGALEADRKILVATLDGKVTMLNRTGHQLWSVKTGPLFSSTISSLQLNENGKWVNLIPSLTGGVYKYDGDSLFPMPFNADSLLKKSFKLSHDVVITGGKELRTFGIDVSTGNIRYECGISGCVSPGAAELNADPPDQSVVLVVKKQLQTVRAIDSSTGVERWNFSVGTHELALAGLTEGCYHGEQKNANGKGADFLKIVIPEGRVFGADRENTVVWDHHFESPISQAWVLENGQLVSIDPITNTPLTGVPSLYIGIHNQQFYVQESQSTAEKMERYFELESVAGGLLKRKPLNIAWKPPAVIDGVSGSTALSTINPTPNWVSFAPTPNFRPIFIYDRDSVGDSILEGPNSTEFDEYEQNDEDSEDDDLDEGPKLDFSEGITQVIVMSLWFWWKEVLGISLLTAVLLNLILMKPIMRAVRSQTIREMSGYFQQLWNRWREEEENRALLARHSSNLLSLPPAESVENDSNTLLDRQRSTSCSSTGSMGTPGTTEDRDREINFSSQYMNEFIPIECLGRGGFGVVFEAKKKIDDRTYAVKRITLPDREKARVRVMREVKALAQLDHRNIVRYFNAWIESPPPGWLEKNDPLWAKTLIGSTSPTDYPSDMFGSSHFTELSRRNKADHSKISFPPTPIDYPVEADEDSYIVFENSTTSTARTRASVETTSTTVHSKPALLPNDTSIPIPPSVDTSVASSVSSAGGGFFARRPTSLNIHSNISSFHEEESQVSEHMALLSHGHHEFTIDEEDAEETGRISPVVIPDIMYLYIQQELCQKRTLQDWLRAERCRDTSLVVKLFSQIVEAVEYVHSKKLIHRDLKPSNIFLAEVTENGLGVLTVKIGDFGLATTAYAELETEKIVATPMDEGSSSSRGDTVRINLTGHVGTHLYMSPEQYHRKPYDYKVDIYSLGLIFFELLVPFTTDMERYNTLSGVRKLSFPSKFRDSFPEEFELIQKMISHNPNERPDATRINSWGKDHISRLSNRENAGESRNRGSGDAFVGRSISSPGAIVTDPDSMKVSSTERRKFFKTQSVM